MLMISGVGFGDLGVGRRIACDALRKKIHVKPVDGHMHGGGLGDAESLGALLERCFQFAIFDHHFAPFFATTFNSTLP